MPLILRQLLGSEKFWYVALLFMLPITLFTALGLMTVDDWRHDALWALGMLLGGKTLQGVADRIGAPRTTPTADGTPLPAAPAVAAPAPSQTTRPMTRTELAELGIRPPVEPPPPIRPGDE